MLIYSLSLYRFEANDLQVWAGRLGRYPNRDNTQGALEAHATRYCEEFIELSNSLYISAVTNKIYIA